MSSTNKEKVDYLLLILNCKRYHYKAALQKNTWLKFIPNNYKYYHIIGNINILNDYEFDDNNNILYVNSKDDYLTLPHKIIMAINAIHSRFDYKYVFKTDDDQFLNNNKLFNILPNIISKYDYGGYNVSVDDHYSQYYLIHNELPKNILLKKATYCNGRFYFLNKNVCSFLLNYIDHFKNSIIEDHAIGIKLMEYPNLKILNFNSNNYFLDIPKYVNTKFHIYTECVNCPEIGINAIKSFFKYHPDYIINVYLTNDDMNYINKQYNNKNINYCIVDDQFKLIYNNGGHRATAILWSQIIQNCKNNNQYIIHFDSDVLFLNNMIDNIIVEMINDYDIVGPIRCYKYNLNNRDDIRNMKDTVATYCFGYNPNKINIDNYDEYFIYMIQGIYTPDRHPILDFFDPITFNMYKNNAKIKYINFDIIGGLNEYGSRNNKYSSFNSLFDVGDKIIHFSAVGSGLNYRKNNLLNNSNISSYHQAGIKSLNIYEYSLYGKEYDDLDDNIREFKLFISNKLQD
jgi:hypothetical protein